MPSVCDVCRELANAYIDVCRELEWASGRQKIEAMRHAFYAVENYEPEIERLNGLRRESLARLFRHANAHPRSESREPD